MQNSVLRLACLSARRISKQSLRSTTILPNIISTTSSSNTPIGANVHQRCTFTSHRHFSSTGGGGKDGDDDRTETTDKKSLKDVTIDDSETDDDPFGVTYQDGPDNLGPTLPPRYKRDPVTGKTTGETETELSSSDEETLKMSEDERVDSLERRIAEGWDEEGEEKIADRLRREEARLNVLGRGPRAASEESKTEGGVVGASKPLSEEEFRTFRKYLEKTDGEAKVSRDDIRVDPRRDGEIPGGGADPDLGWLAKATGKDDDSWMEDIMPSDLSPIKKMNRKEAKPLPKELLHHNNLELIKRYTTPAGQILSRMKTRLSTKDQRKVSKLVKRARHLGLIPYVGQWKLVDSGDHIKDDLERLQEWEIELEKRGLNVYKKTDGEK